ncbi:MAG: NUDIX domain-containing protein [Gemmatimonadetes bacterium]|nr:NUDIX domain-containing protein [Gemmatimonadota bacterium]
MVVSFPEVGTITNRDLTYVVIVAETKGKWIFCKHKDRDTWEIPGGHIEPGEKPMEAAARELHEETGAETFELKRICTYSVEHEERTSYGLLFHAQVEKLKKMLNSEISEISLDDNLPEKLTYPEIQPDLFHKVKTELAKYRR